MRIAAGIHPSLNLVDMTAESFVKNSEAISAAAPTVWLINKKESDCVSEITFNLRVGGEKNKNSLENPNSRSPMVPGLLMARKKTNEKITKRKVEFSFIF